MKYHASKHKHFLLSDFESAATHIFSLRSIWTYNFAEIVENTKQIYSSACKQLADRIAIYIGDTFPGMIYDDERNLGVNCVNTAER